MSGRTDESGVFEPDGPEESASAMQQFDQEYAMPEPRGPEGANQDTPAPSSPGPERTGECPDCGGKGYDADDETVPTTCEACQGTGKAAPTPSSPSRAGEPDSEHCAVCGLPPAECRSHPSPSPAGPGEAELVALLDQVTCAPSCNRNANWDEAASALADCPDEPEKYQAEMELAEKRQRCTCYRQQLRSAVRALLARLREAEETYTDEHGTVWSVPTAWAYMRACRALEEQHSGTDTLRAEVARLGAENERLNKVAGENFAVAVEAQERLATARTEEREAWWDLVDRAANALNDSICASGNRVSTNMHWVNKLRRDGEALRTREAAP